MADSPAGRAFKVRVTLGPALIDVEATLEDIVMVVTRLTQEFDKGGLLPQVSGGQGQVIKFPTKPDPPPAP